MWTKYAGYIREMEKFKEKQKRLYNVFFNNKVCREGKCPTPKTPSKLPKQ